MKRKIIIDTDIGDDIDDAYALIYATKNQHLDIIGVTTVYRNSKERAQLAKALLNALGKQEIFVAAGEDYTYKTPFIINSFEKTLPDGRPEIPHFFPEFKEEKFSRISAIDFILSSAAKYRKKLTIAAIGPLTNLAKAWEKNPKVFKKIKEIVCMGGHSKGNYAEWNIRCDAEAAAKVLESGVKITFIGLDVTKETCLTEEEEKKLTNSNDNALILCAKMLKKWKKDNPLKQPTMHDSLAIAEIDNNFCTYEKRKIIIPIEGEEKAFTITEKKGKKARVAISVDRKAFMKHFINKVCTD